MRPRLRLCEAEDGGENSPSQSHPDTAGHLLVRGDRAEFGDFVSSEFVKLTVSPSAQGFRQTAPKDGVILGPKAVSWPVAPNLQ